MYCRTVRTCSPQWTSDISKRPKRTNDLGCGSGIIKITEMKEVALMQSQDGSICLVLSSAGKNADSTSLDAYVSCLTFSQALRVIILMKCFRKSHPCWNLIDRKEQGKKGGRNLWDAAEAEDIWDLLTCSSEKWEDNGTSFITALTYMSIHLNILPSVPSNDLKIWEIYCSLNTITPLRLATLPPIEGPVFPRFSCFYHSSHHGSHTALGESAWRKYLDCVYRIVDLTAKSYLTLKSWCSCANGVCDPSCSRRVVMEVSRRQKNIYSLASGLHCSCISTLMLDRIGSQVIGSVPDTSNSLLPTLHCRVLQVEAECGESTWVMWWVPRSSAGWMRKKRDLSPFFCSELNQQAIFLQSPPNKQWKVGPIWQSIKRGYRTGSARVIPIPPGHWGTMPNTASRE